MVASPFDSALERMKFNEATRQQFELNGIVSLDELTMMLPAELESWVANTRKSSSSGGPSTRGSDPKDAILFPFVSMKKLRAYRAWAIYRKACGLDEIPDGFTAALQEAWISHFQIVSEEKEQTKYQPALSSLDSFDDWVVWEELFTSSLRKTRNGRTGFTLEYPLRPKAR
jgi:hypothetical protein